jgi:hypothetical protein
MTISISPVSPQDNAPMPDTVTLTSFAFKATGTISTSSGTVLTDQVEGLIKINGSSAEHTAPPMTFTDLGHGSYSYTIGLSVDPTWPGNNAVLTIAVDQGTAGTTFYPYIVAIPKTTVPPKKKKRTGYARKTTTAKKAPAGKKGSTKKAGAAKKAPVKKAAAKKTKAKKK